MNQNSELLLLLANDRIRSRVIDAANARLARAQVEAVPRPSIRRLVGHQIIRIGERLAEEPNLQPARSR
jgi:hypothetical protein